MSYREKKMYDAGLIHFLKLGESVGETRTASALGVRGSDSGTERPTTTLALSSNSRHNFAVSSLVADRTLSAG